MEDSSSLVASACQQQQTGTSSSLSSLTSPIHECNNESESHAVANSNTEATTKEKSETESPDDCPASTTLDINNDQNVEIHSATTHLEHHFNDNGSSSIGIFSSFLVVFIATTHAVVITIAKRLVPTFIPKLFQILVHDIRGHDTIDNQLTESLRFGIRGTNGTAQIGKGFVGKELPGLEW